jgi:predicted dehydrogenase
MTLVSRRNFILSTLSAGSAFLTTPVSSFTRPFSRILGANDQIRVAIIGLRGKGKHHIELFHGLPGVRITAICDVDREILNSEADKFKARNEKVTTYIDYRNLLEDRNVDAVIIATPNHWHSLMGIWACQAGKDVYVEKPVSHNVHEGRQLVKAARKYKRIVQTGTQSRSDEALQEVFEYLQKGNLGKIKAVYGLCYKRRESIGLANGPQPVPSSINYDLWTGPAPMHPLKRLNIHYDWHWVWETGNGDIGNQGVHQMDQCRWVLGQNKLPGRVISFGGRFGYEDDGETPNSQITVFDYQPVPLIFEVQGLPAKKGDSAMSHYKGVRVGLVVKCENGYFTGSAGGGWIFDNQDKKIRQFSSGGGETHHVNFIKAVGSRNSEDLNADILDGHLSSTLCHLANISYRLGSAATTDEIKRSLISQPESLEALEHFKENLFSNWVDLSADNAFLGPVLQFDAENEKFTGNGEYSLNRWANDLLTRYYRPPFTVPEEV